MLLTCSVYSQADTSTVKMETIFGETEHVGWWVSPDFSYTKFDSRDGWLGGLSGGVIINHSFSIGFGGYGIINSNTLDYGGILDTAYVYLYGGYGGLKLEYRLNPMRKVHIAFPLLIGGGAVGYTSWNYHDYYGYPHDEYYYYNDYYVWDEFFVIEPGVVIGINLLPFMRFDAGISYRYAPSIELPQTDNNLMNSFNATMSMKFGKF